MKNLKVSIGITAYNEQNNIRFVLQDVLKQYRKGWNLEEILILNDGSTDLTSYEVKKVRSKLIKPFEFKLREGKSYRLSQMFKQFKGDILIMFDGDIRLANKNVITNLIDGFDNQKVMLIGGNSTPYPAKNFFQRSVATTFSVFYKSRISIKSGNNVFGCTGSILAIRKKLAQMIKLPAVINEDVFIYMSCLKMGYEFRYQDNAKVFYKLPSNLKDYLRQLFRSTPQAVEIELEKYFGRLVSDEFSRPSNFYIRSIYSEFLRNPFELMFAVSVNLVCKLFYPFVSRNYKLSWFTATSTH